MADLAAFSIKGEVEQAADGAAVRQDQNPAVG